MKPCTGCLSLLITSAYKKECRFTKFGTSHMKKCPCKICLVKVICKSMCKNFSTFAEEYNNRVSKREKFIYRKKSVV